MSRQPPKSVDEMTPEEREAYMEEQMDRLMAKKLGMQQISPAGRSQQRYKTPGFNTADRKEAPNPPPQQPVVVLDQQIDSRSKPRNFEREFDEWRAQKYNPAEDQQDHVSFRGNDNQPASQTGRQSQTAQ